MSKVSLLTVCAFAVCAFEIFFSSALAEERMLAPEGLRKEQVNRVVTSGSKQRIGGFFALNPDCTASGEVNVRVTKQPEHGTVETAVGTFFPAYPKENLRARCNEHKVRGQGVFYKSAEKYVGDDVLELLVFFPNGFAWEITYNVSVR